MKINDPAYLRGEQYRDSTNLNARAALHQRFSTNPQGWFTWLFEQSGIQPGERLLELGGGPGYLWQKCIRRLPAGCRLHFSDFSSGMAAEARRTLSAAGAALDFAILDAQHIPYADASFDRVMAHYMLYHVPDRSGAIREIWRVLRPGGVLLTATNGRNHLREIHGFMQTAFGKHAFGTPAGGSQFDLENGAEQLRGCFPRVELRRYPDSLRVTQVQPILDYLFSMWEGEREAYAEQDLANLRAELEERIRRDGAIEIAKDSGLFVAQKPA